jgi:hypothetical protein
MIILGVAAAAGLAYYFLLRKPSKKHHHKETYQRSTMTMASRTGQYVADQVDYAYRPKDYPHYQADPADKMVPLEETTGTDLYADARIADGWTRTPGVAGMADGNRTRRVLLQAGDYGLWRDLTGMPAEGVSGGANVEAAYSQDDGHPILYQ